MMPFSMKSTVVRVLLILGAMIVTLLIAWVVLQLNGSLLDWVDETQSDTRYFACMRALLYSLIFASWTAALRLRPTSEDQQRLLRLGPIGFSSIILVELLRV
ncbi:hypothetical protein ACIP01_05580 [Pseudomonas monteilii]|uniref:hypothetical protein n=1 Tax=Pseudomonas monteilii TaxID=76759 RepID=UPI0037F25EC9